MSILTSIEYFYFRREFTFYFCSSRVRFRLKNFFSRSNAAIAMCFIPNSRFHWTHSRYRSHRRRRHRNKKKKSKDFIHRIQICVVDHSLAWEMKCVLRGERHSTMRKCAKTKRHSLKWKSMLCIAASPIISRLSLFIDVKPIWNKWILFRW